MAPVQIPTMAWEKLTPLVRDRYSPEDLDVLEDVLREAGLFDFPLLANGLHGAVSGGGEVGSVTGYCHTWVRDAVHVAEVRWRLGEVEGVGQTATSLLKWFVLQAPRFEVHIAGTADQSDPMSRPHVRFKGESLEESDEWWPHAQNDALGYGLWFLCRSALSGLHFPDIEGVDALGRFPRYFQSIAYWDDIDSGHWEETPKRNASSIGAVIAGLRAMRGLLRSDVFEAGRDRLASVGVDEGLLVDLMARGQKALQQILPFESVNPDMPHLDRHADGALLFLIHPLWIVDPRMTGRIVDLVRKRLLGPHGIRRYEGDSYWCADYLRLFDEKTRTSGFQGDLSQRDAALKPGTEAQWSLFDPLLSVIFGRRYQATRGEADLVGQTHHFHRALSFLTGEDHVLGPGRMPEAWYLPDSSQPDHWQPNDNVPLLWAQAQLVDAFLSMRASVGETEAEA